MNCHNIREKFPDFLIGDTDAATQNQVQAHLADCQECRNELESLSAIWTKLGVLPEERPSDALRGRFYSMLEAYKQGLEAEKPQSRWQSRFSSWLTRFWPQQPAFQFSLAMLLLVVGLTGGFILKSTQTRSADLTPLRQEMDSMRTTLAMSLLDNQSASERLRGVSLSSQMTKPDSRLLATLINTLENDSNPNVRLAAVEALYLFRDLPEVRQGLSGSLAKQSSPLVQVALIDLIVSIKEQRAINALRSLIQDEKLDPLVKERAEQGLERLL
jgi:hypothetical protein